MHQVLFSVRGFALHTYGVLIALGFLVGIVLAARAARRAGLPAERILDLCFWILVAGLVGARVLYIVVNAGDYVSMCREGVMSGSRRELLWRCSAVLHVWEGGLVFYGGFLAALGTVAYYVRRHRLPFLQTADVLAPSLAIGHFFGRLGCFAAGCCFGKVCRSGFGARFPRGSVAYEDLFGRGLIATGSAVTPPLHATQLYEAGGELVIFVLVTVLARRKRAHGQVLLAYLASYALLRAVVELFRGDAGRKMVLELATPRLSAWLGLSPAQAVLLSTSQLLSLLAVAGALALYVVLRRRARAHLVDSR